MDLGLVYVKTPTGDEAVRQSTHVVQRNLRMVLVQVDGKLSVAEMAVKIGNVQLVEDALRKLEEGGFIAPSQNGVTAPTVAGRCYVIAEAQGIDGFDGFREALQAIDAGDEKVLPQMPFNAVSRMR